MKSMIKHCGIVGAVLVMTSLAGCQVPDINSTSTFSLAGDGSTATKNGSSQSEEAALQYAGLTRLPKPQDRPYHRALYDGDIELDIVANPKIDGVTGREIKLLSPSFRRRQSSLPFARRAILYNSTIRKHAKLNGIDYELARAIIYTESSFRVNALGRHGEIGLMQVKPSTARSMGYRGTKNQLYLPENNIKYGMKYLKKAQDLGNGTVCGMILKYNAGLYAKRMNPISARYCQKVKRLMRQAKGARFAAG
jgi:hypothetical protein